MYILNMANVQQITKKEGFYTLAILLNWMLSMSVVKKVASYW